MENSCFFSHKECEYYPCHKDIEDINCLFCFCPLYNFMDCGGAYSLTKAGVKDCSNCVKPHQRDNYNLIIERLIHLEDKHHGTNEH